MEFFFSPLFSSSSGNSLYVSAGGTCVLIDAGGTGAQMEAALAAISVQAKSLDGILITHEHSDHIKSAGILSRKHDIPIFANAATWRAMDKKIGTVVEKNRKVFNQSFYIKDMLVEPFSIPHDAADPVCYALSSGGIKLATLTDLGHATKRLLGKLAGANVVLLEANHDEDMLRFGSYPQYLKQRILGTRGHLSNLMAAKAAYELVTMGVKGIMLAHLSEQNNTPEAAFETVCVHLREQGIEVGRHVAVSVLKKECDAFVYRLNGND
jgi:phosphoribosyl 1,2-cyclic phosphodiesterase